MFLTINFYRWKELCNNYRYNVNLNQFNMLTFFNINLFKNIIYIVLLLINLLDKLKMFRYKSNYI